MTREERQAMFNTATFFNRQASGLKINELTSDAALSRNLQVLAVFSGDDDFIAIVEGKKVPLYAFTYAVEMVQFYFEDSTETLDNNQLDHTIIARRHAQTIANMIADEARLSSHTFSEPEEIFEKLIRHSKVVTMLYQGVGVDQETMPAGMSAHDVYLLQ